MCRAPCSPEILPAAVLTDARATGQPWYVWAADETGIARQARATAGSAYRWIVTDPDLPTESGTAAGARITPITGIRTGVAVVDAGSVTLGARQADTGSARCTRTACAANQTAATGVVSACRTSATFVVAAGIRTPAPSDDREQRGRQAGLVQHTSSRREFARQRIESSLIHTPSPVLSAADVAPTQAFHLPSTVEKPHVDARTDLASTVTRSAWL
jgi:hypothetical protein